MGSARLCGLRGPRVFRAGADVLWFGASVEERGAAYTRRTGKETRCEKTREEGGRLTREQSSPAEETGTQEKALDQFRPRWALLVVAASQLLELFFGKRVLRISFQDLPVVGYRLLSFLVRCVGHRQQVVGPHRGR